MFCTDTRSGAPRRARFAQSFRTYIAVFAYALVTVSAGCGEDTPTAVTTASPPSAPTGVNAVAGNASVTVTWTAVAGATGYRVYWDTAGSVDSADSVVTVTQSPFEHTSLANGTDYYYRVSALNGAGESALSAQVSTMPTGAADFRLIACGAGFSFLVNDAGSLYAWGNNTFGQLGIGSFTHMRQPTVVRGIGDIVAVDASGRHVLALTGSGRAYAWGSNDWGQLGDGSRSLRWTPYAVTGPTDFVAIAVGEWHSLGVTSDGSLWTWGRAPGSPSAYLVPTKVSGVFQAPGVVAAGEDLSLFKPTNAGTISSGTYSWGVNTFGQLGDGTTAINTTPTVISGTTDIVTLSARMHHVVGVRDNGSLVVWGRNIEGQLGDGTTNDSTTPIPPLVGSSAKAVGAGYFHTIALRNDGQVLAWGLNESGQVGDGTFTNRLVAVNITSLVQIEMIAAGSSHNLALKSDGTLWAWGANGSGQLGDNTVTNRNVPVRVTGY